MKFLFKHIHGSTILFNDGNFLLWLREGTFVHLLVLIQRNGINLHGDGWYHIRRLFIENKLIESIYIDGLITNNICCNKLATALIVESLHSSILDTRELADDSLYFLQFNTETSNLDLPVTAPYELDITRRQISNDVTSSIDTGIFPTVRLCVIFIKEGIGYVDFSRLFRTVEVSAADLWSADPQFSSCTYRHAMSLGVNNI